MNVGVFAGTFDPIHKGHVELAKLAAQKCQLDKIIFLLEKKPRGKQNVTEFEHRLNMLKLAIEPYQNFGVLELPDDQFTIKKTLPEIQKKFPNSELWLLIGSDLANSLPDWPGFEQLLKNVNLIIGLRSDDQSQIQKLLQELAPKTSLTILSSPSADISASRLRAKPSTGSLDNQVKKYIETHHLYEP